MPRFVSRSLILVALVLLLLATPMNALAQSDTRVGLRNLAQGSVPFAGRFGTAVLFGRLLNWDSTDPIYPLYIASEYNMLEMENEMKPALMWLGPGEYDTNAADFLLGKPGQAGWARQHGMVVRGDPLVYPGDGGWRNPTWLLNNEANITAAQAKQYLSDYIRFVVGRYRGKVVAYDVINECIDDGQNGNEFNLRNDFWYRKLGKNYLLYACQFAYEADPTTELYVNDYDVEFAGWKADAQLAVVQWLRSQTNRDGSPIRVGIGLQYHLVVGTVLTPGDAYYAVVNRLQTSNIPFMITELDVRVPVTDGVPGIHPVNPDDLNTQGAAYRSVLTLAKGASLCRGFQTWGAHDNYSWIPWSFGGWGAALPADANYAPKPAYLAMQEVMGRPIADGTYSISLRGATDQVLSVLLRRTPSRLALARYTGAATQKWQVTWNSNRGTYRLAPISDSNAALDTYLWNSYPVGGLQTSTYGILANNQEWLITPTSDGFYRIAPRLAKLRAVGTRAGFATGSSVGITNFDNGPDKQWQFQAR